MFQLKFLNEIIVTLKHSADSFLAALNLKQLCFTKWIVLTVSFILSQQRFPAFKVKQQ